MRFKVFFVREKEKLIKSELKLSDKDRETIIEYTFEDNFHCFKILNNHSIEEKGIEKEDHEFINSTEFFETNDAKRLVSLAYVFINTLNGNIYTYNYANVKLERLLMRFFLLSNIDTKVDMDRLKAITKIEVKLKNDPQYNFFYENVTLEGFDLTKELGMQDKEIETFTARYEFNKKGAIFGKNNLEKVLRKYENLTIEGIDAHDNILKIKDGVQLVISIDMPFSDFKELKSFMFSSFIDKICEKEKSALNDY